MLRLGVYITLIGLFLVMAPLAHAFDTGDLNQDGIVDRDDLAIAFQAWRDFRAGTSVASLPGLEPRADIDHDGDIDHDDFAAIVGDFLHVGKASVNTADFLVFHVGDKRYWVDPDNIYQWKDMLVALSGYADGVDEKHLPVLEVDEVHDQWRMTGGHIFAHGIYLGGQAYTYATEMQLPDKLLQGTAATVESDVMQDAANKGHLSLTLTLVDVDQTVVTPAHTYSHCAEIRVVRHGTINTVPYDDDSIYWLAPGLGWVQRDRDPSNPGTFMARLQYLKVGTTEYGTIPTALVANLYPLAVNNLLIVKDGNTVDGQKVFTTTKSLSGVTVAMQGSLGLPGGRRRRLLQADVGVCQRVGRLENARRPV